MKKYMLFFIGVSMFVGSPVAIVKSTQSPVKSQKIRYRIGPKTITFYGKLNKFESRFIYLIK